MTATTDERPRIAILWQGLAGYSHALFTALTSQGVDLQIHHSALGPNAPFDETAVTQGLRTSAWNGEPDAHLIERALDEFDPHAMLVSSWHIGVYRRAARRRRGRTLRILCMDNQWWARPKQVLGVGVSPVMVRPAYDAAFVPGERSADFAGKLGFPDERVIRGIYSCDHNRFDAVAEDRGDEAPPQAFVFVGRLVPEKGVDVLTEAYRRYRGLADDPWPLFVSGVGPDADRVSEVPGVEMLGFVQPHALPQLLGRSGCLVLPSRFEPWGVVVHEATAAGLPVVCTSVVGASSRLVLDGYNGVVVSPGNVDSLARALLRISGSSAGERVQMSRASRALGRQFTPERCASNLLTRIRELRGLIGLADMPGRSVISPSAGSR